MSKTIPKNHESNNPQNPPNQDNMIIDYIISQNSKSIYLITKSFDSKIPDILSYIQNENFPIKNKLIILKYLENLFTKIPHNSEIFSKKFSNSKKNLNIFEVIINEYVLIPSENANQEYLNTLKDLFALLLTQISFEEDSYHYLLSFISNYIDNINNDCNLEKKINSENLSKILQLMRIYYQSVQGIDEPYNYLFFNGEQDSYMIINNKENTLNFDEEKTLNILLFIRLLSPDIIKQVNQVADYKFLEIIFSEINITIGADIDNYLLTNLTNEKLVQLECNKIINILVTIYQKNKKIQTEIFVNNVQVYSTSNQKITSENSENNIDDNKNDVNDKNDFKIKKLILFKNFIGHCSNIIIYKDKIEEISLPKFMLCPYNINQENKETLKSIYINGIYKEEIFSFLIQQQLKDDKTISFLNNISKSTINDKNSESDIKDFLEKNIIAIYIPNRVIKLNNYHLILKDSINHLDCNFYINTPSLNGIHLFHRLIDNYIPFGGLNHLLPFIELMNMHQDFLTSDNLCNFFNLVTFIFTPFYQKLLASKKKDFFFNLSYFLEKIPDNFFDGELAYNLITISSFLLTLTGDKNYNELINQFHKYILLNEEIIFKFKQQERNTIFQQVVYLIDKIDINIFSIIEILLTYDKEKYTKFCCKHHSEYFNQKSEYLEPNLMNLLKPIEVIITKFFEKFVKEASKSEHKTECETGNKLLKLFEILTFDVSPCLQKIIITMFFNFVKKHYAKYFGFLNIDNKIIDISLFIYKNSIFDIKIDVIKFLYFITKTQITNNDENYLNNRTKSWGFACQIDTFDKEKEPFMLNYILPYYLYGDGVLTGDTFGKLNSSISFVERSSRESVNYKNSENLSAPKTKSEKKINKTKKFFGGAKQNNNKNINNNEYNNVKYHFRKISQNQQKIAYNYKIENLHNLLNELYDNIFSFFKEANNTPLNLNLLIKIVSKGDLNLINKFLSDIKNEVSKKTKLVKEIYDNKNLLHWLLETGFQFYMLKQSKFDKKIFVCEINLGTSPINEEDCNKNIENIENNIINILKNNIYKLDYIFTWSKYYYELRSNENKFVLVREYIFKFLKECGKLIENHISKPEKEINKKQEEAIYYFNLLFEFITYYKLSGSKGDQSKEINIIYEELAGSFKHILLYEINNGSPIYTTLKSKWKDFNFYSKIYLYFKPLWSDDKISKEENDIFTKLILRKNDMYINNLQILFYKCEDSEKVINNNCGNNGIYVVYMLYYFFMLLFNIGGSKDDVKDLFKDFRLFITLLIISTCTLTITTDKKKKTFPKESEYKSIQEITRIILFHCLEFYVNMIDNINEYIYKYKLSKDSEEKTLYKYNCDIKNILIDNFAYLLKLLDRIYTEPEHNKKSGAYLLFEQLYIHLDLKKQKENNFLNDLKKINIKFKDSKSKSDELEKIIKKFLDSNQVKDFFNSEKHSKEYIYPFAKYIKKREELISYIIPIYDNRAKTFKSCKNLCLSPFYIQDCSYDKKLDEIIKKINKDITNEISLNEKNIDFEKYFRIRKYIKIKKKLFSFHGIWSNENYFYDTNNYSLKYKIANHLTTDYTKILMTPILNLDYYLPKFSKYKPDNLFRTLPNKKSIYYPVDLSYMLNKKKILVENKNGNIINNIINNNISNNKEKNIFDSSSNIINIKKKYNNLYNLKIENYKFLEENSSNIEDKDKEKDKDIFLNYISQKHLSKISSYDIEIDACLVKIDFHICGIVYINSEEIGFYGYEPKHYKEEEGYDFDRNVCFGSIFKFQAKKYTYYYIKIPYNEIIFILKRTYYFKKTALEFFTINNKSYFFRFNENNFKNVYDSIRHYMKPDIEEIYIEYSKYEDKIGFFSKNNYKLSNNFVINNSIKNMNLKFLYEKWYKWEISTLKILNIINLYANRTLNDINQYPVFPWIITDYTSENLPILNNKNNNDNNENNLIRPFGTPMGMLDYNEDAKERKNNYLDTWANNELEADKDENYDRYGSHYSTSLYITYYLVRIFPFSSMRIELQGKNFDDPNRLFNSLLDSFNCALTQKADLRELIPEMFCFPELFYNLNNLNLGEIKNDSKNIYEDVNDVLLPKWTNNNGYNFIYHHRKFLESPEISKKINEWINIIFGYKQKGSSGKKIGNLFCKQTYEDYDEIFSKSELNEKIYLCRMVEFGLTPHQIFKNEAYHRLNYSETRKKIQIFKNFTEFCKSENGKTLEISKETKIESNDYKNLIPYKLFLFKNDEDGNESKKTFILTNKIVKKYSRFNPVQPDRKTFSSSNFDIKNIDFDELNNKLKTTPVGKNNLSSQSEMILFLPKYRMSLQESPNIFYDKGNYIALGGFWNGNIIIENLIDNNKRTKNKSKEIIIYSTGENSPIIHICLDQTETYAICGNLKGSIFIYIINVDKKSEWNLYKKIHDHFSEITSIAVNDNLNIFITCDREGFCMIYTLPKCKLINSFKFSDKLPKDYNQNYIYCSNITLISHTPLPCFIFYFKEIKNLCVFSINLKYITGQNLDFEITYNGIKKFTDQQFVDYLLIYNNKKNSIDIYNILDLNILYSKSLFQYTFIDFGLWKELDDLVILVKQEFKDNEKNLDKNESVYKILMMKTSSAYICTSKNENYSLCQDNNKEINK